LWYFANVGAIAGQLPYRLLPAYVQKAPDPARAELPYPHLPELDLTEGPHVSYALQWFAFAAVLLFGYPFFIRKRESNQ
jgi:surfeit locus 1 family protein